MNSVISQKIPTITDFRIRKVTEKKRTPKVSSIAKNGLSIELLRKIGHRISVHHYRAYYSDDVDRIIYLPSSTRYEHDEYLVLLPHGGYTRLGLSIATTVDSPLLRYADISDNIEALYFAETLYYMSRCAEEDLFCYKIGVTTALDLIPVKVAQALLNGKINEPIL